MVPPRAPANAAPLQPYRNTGANRRTQCDELSRALLAAATAWRSAVEGLRTGLWAAQRLPFTPGWRWWRRRGQPPRLLPARVYPTAEAYGEEQLGWIRAVQRGEDDDGDARPRQVREAVTAAAQWIVTARALEAFRRTTGFPLGQAADRELRALATWQRRRRRLLGKAAAWALVAREVGVTVSQLRRFARARPA